MFFRVVFGVQHTNKRIRAAQRRQIIQEVEDKELTFAPKINQKSLDVRTKHAYSRMNPHPLVPHAPEFPYAYNFLLSDVFGSCFSTVRVLTRVRTHAYTHMHTH